jgi:hypothetical protein
LSYFVALDPGLAFPAVAAYDQEQDSLLFARRVKLAPELKGMSVVSRCVAIAHAVYLDLRSSDCAAPSALICEWPQIYQSTRSKGDPNQLVPLAGIACALLARMGDSRGLSPKPGEVWGRLPKSTKGDPWESPRGRRLAQRLRSDERAVVQDKHDALDAAGLCLYVAGRWKARKNYAGAV